MAGDVVVEAWRRGRAFFSPLKLCVLCICTGFDAGEVWFV